jgi:antitoxin HigA-1
VAEAGRRIIRPSHPGEILREDFMPDYALSVAGLARALGVSRQTVNELLRERRALSPDMAIRLGRLFGNSPDFWLNAQRAIDLWEAEQTVGNAIEPMEPVATGRQASDAGGRTVPARFHLDPDRLALLCERRGILRLAVFGSVLRDDFTPESDLDILVTFVPGAKTSLFDLVDIADELSEMTGRHVDLVPAGGLKAAIRQQVLASARTVYEAA